MTPETRSFLKLTASWINYWRIISISERETILALDPTGEILVVEDDADLEGLDGAPLGLSSRISLVREQGLYRLWSREEYNRVILRSRLFAQRIATRAEQATKERAEMEARAMEDKLARTALALSKHQGSTVEEATATLRAMTAEKYEQVSSLLLS